jgi:hypothetical protein
MVRFFSTSAAGVPSLSAAEIFRARKLVPTVINHVVAGERGSDVGTHLRDLHLHDDHSKDQERLQQIGGDHDAKGN